MTREQIINEIKRFFNVSELVCDHTFAKFGDKAWQFLDTDYLHALLIIRRDIIKMPMYCNSKTQKQRGLRCNRCQMVRSKAGPYLSPHCFDAETEILTTDGWKKHDEMTDDAVLFTYNMESGQIEKKPVAFITKESYTGKMVRFDSKNIDCLVTPDHDMLLHYIPDKYIRVGNKKYTEKGIAYFDSLKTNNDKWHKEPAINQVGKRRIFMCAGDAVKEKECNLNLMKFCMATIADGCFKYKGTSPSISFRFKKERKCKQIEALLSELGWYYTKSLDKNGVWNYYIRSEYAQQVLDIIGPKKNIPKSILDFGAESLRELVEYYAFYDGCHSKRASDKHFSICTTNKYNADMLQLMGTLSGMRSQYYTKRREIYQFSNSIGQAKDAYILTINPSIKESRMNGEGTSVVDYNGTIWCATTKNGTVITRRNGKISIQGNCLGKAGDFTVTGMNAQAVREKIKANADLLPCKVRLERWDASGNEISWVHIDTIDSGPQQPKVYEFKA